MIYQAWEDLLEDGDEPLADAPVADAPDTGGASPAAIDPTAVLHEVPALAELLRRRGELEQRMASLLGGEAPAASSDTARERRRVGAPQATAAERSTARKREAEQAARHELARGRAAQQRQHDDAEARRRQHLLDRGRRRLVAQTQRLREAERLRVQHLLELAEQRYLAVGRERSTPHRGLGNALADTVDRARAPLREWKTQRTQMQDQLREQLTTAKQDPKLQEALRDDPTALDDLDELDDELDEALALPDAWAERIDAEAQRWSDRLRMADTWGDRARRLSVDDAIDALEQLDRLRQHKRERAESERKDQRAERRADARRAERKREAAGDGSRSDP